MTLRDAGELFEQPERTPLEPDYEPWCTGPGAEHLVSLLRADPGARVVVQLPSSGPGSDDVRAALARYGSAHADRLEREIKAELRSGLLALIPAAIVFAGALALSRLANNASSHWVASTIAEALVVVGWVVAWAPIAVFGTDIWLLRGRRRAYRRLASEAIEVR
jgi:hypothetical protein